ncbi:MAG: hypothetical protein ACPGSL_01325 [Vicingaceae bacterium]
MIPVIGFFDLTLATLYLLLIYVGAVVYRNKKIKTNPEYKYFIGALTAKLIGGVGFAVFSIYYYKGGDTFVFFNAADGLSNYLFTDFGKAIDVYMLAAENFNPAIHVFAPSYNYILNSVDVLAIVKITSLVNLFGWGSYLVTSILFACLSFLGLWFGYVSFCRLYIKLKKQLLFPFFLVPSAILWSSGILKDTVTIGIIGWMLYAFANLFIFKRKFLFSIFAIVVGSYIMFLLKPYILYVLLPCMLIWIQSNVRASIKGSFVRALVTPVLIVVFVVSGYFLTQQFSAGAGKYSIGKIEKTLEGFHSWHSYLARTRDQSGYTLGEIDFTPVGIFLKSPAALNVTFFRPYLWEVRNLPTLLGAFEGLILFLMFCYILVKTRLKIISYILKNKEALFSMLFALVFGVVVGISSYNFGALSRYKIPAQFFFILSLILVFFESTKTKTN